VGKRSLLTNWNDPGIMRVLRLSLKYSKGDIDVIICICEGKNERDVNRAIDSGAKSLRDLQRCGIGGQCGSCHNSLRGMLARAAAAEAVPCPACTGTPAAEIHAVV